MDDKYIRQVLEGDIESFRHIVSKYRDMSFSISMSIVKSELIAEEAVQDAFVKAFQNLEQFRFKSSFSTWFYKIVVNESLRKIRKKKIDIVGIDPEIENSNFNSGDAISNLHEEAQKEIINQVLNLMPESESLLLRLFYLDENDIAAICEITGLSQSNSKVILHRARKRFYTILESTFKHEMRTIL